MRKSALLLGCAALLLAGTANADPRYHFEFHFVHATADTDTFRNDRDRCLGDTAKPQAGDLLVTRGSGTFRSWGENSRYQYHATAFLNCMKAKGYQTQPAGPFAFQFTAYI